MGSEPTDERREPPFEGGAQRVPERRPEVPGGGRTVMQAIVIALAVLAVLAGLIWFLVPLGAR